MDEFLNTKIFGVKWSRLLTNIQQTLLIGTIIGFILALALVLTRKGGILKGTGARIVHAVLNFYVNVVRSVPFVILLVTIMPFTRLLMGTTIGSTAALVPLVGAAGALHQSVSGPANREQSAGMLPGDH